MGCAGRGTSWRTRCWQSLIDMSIHTITHSWISNLDGMTMAAESGNNNNPKNKKKTIQIFWCSRVFFFHIIYIHILILYRSRVMDEGNLFIRKTTEPDDDDDDDSFFFPSSFLFCFFFWSNFGSETNITAGWRKNLFIRTCFRFGAGGKEKKKRDVIRRPDSLFNWSSDLFVSFGVYLHKRIIGTDWPATENWPRWITKRKPDNIRSSIDRDKQRGRWPQTPKKKEER